MSWLSRLFYPLYVFDMVMKTPDGKRTPIRIVGTDLNDFGKQAFMAGFRYGQEHPDYKEKGSSQ